MELPTNGYAHDFWLECAVSKVTLIQPGVVCDSLSQKFLRPHMLAERTRNMIEKFQMIYAEKS